MGLIVQKFGGTSVGSVEKIENVASRVIEEKERGNDVVVVVSAMGKTTDQLVKMAEEISENPSKREMDMLLTTGEQITISLLTMALIEKGYQCYFLYRMAGWNYDGRSSWKCKDIKYRNRKDSKPIREWEDCRCCWFSRKNRKG